MGSKLRSSSGARYDALVIFLLLLLVHGLNSSLTHCSTSTPVPQSVSAPIIIAIPHITLSTDHAVLIQQAINVRIVWYGLVFK